MPFRNALVSSLAMLLMFAPSAGFAHHGWSSYDSTKPLSVTAPLSSVSWGNPHGSAKVMWQKKEWTLVLAPVSRMEARGLTKAMLTSGKPVTLVGYPRSDGTAEMRIERVTVDRKTVELR
ncbi:MULTISPECIES: DUF6152 family protein [Sphingobium]|uniref:DUF6152 family protein n=1 Tax=Sphingobium sp. MI1205 TaxID=407020 RepID=UPI0007703025|nr:DUF6152 family protein [Sphingobium sp. MI1205]AMK20189.1 hypothetical protein K663_19141 [Sphingobium sp. MI1205]